MLDLSRSDLVLVNEDIRMKSLFRAFLKRKGSTREELICWGPNAKTQVGRTLQCGLMIGSGTAPSHIALGTGVTALPDPDTNTVLEAETHRTSASRSVSDPAVGYYARYEAVITFAGTFTITKAGLLNAASGGTLYAEQLWTPGTLVGSGDAIRVVWDLNA